MSRQSLNRVWLLGLPLASLGAAFFWIVGREWGYWGDLFCFALAGIFLGQMFAMIFLLTTRKWQHSDGPWTISCSISIVAIIALWFALDETSAHQLASVYRLVLGGFVGAAMSFLSFDSRKV